MPALGLRVVDARRYGFLEVILGEGLVSPMRISLLNIVSAGLGVMMASIMVGRTGLHILQAQRLFEESAELCPRALPSAFFETV